MQVTVTVTVTVTAGEGVEHNIEVTSSEPMTAAQLASRLGLLLELDKPPALSSEGHPIPAEMLVGGPRLRTGARLVLGPAGPRSAGTSSVLEARVISGPDCGLRAPLSRGTHVVGRSSDADVVIADHDLSRRHAELEVTNAGVLVRDLSSTNGTRIDGVTIDGGGVQLNVGQLLQLGASTVTLIGATEPPAAVRAKPNGTVEVNRPPRLSPHELDAGVEFPAFVEAGRTQASQWLATLLPAVLGVGLAAALRNIEFLAFALLSPVSVMAGTLSDRRARRKEQRRTVAAFHAAEQLATKALSTRTALETTQRRRAHPDAAAIAHTAATPDCRLWERRPGDPDFLTIRLGCADQPARVRVTRAGADLTGAQSIDAPVVLDLSKGALGIAGPTPYARGLARWVVAQLLVLHSPNELSLVAIVDDAEWRWTRWTASAVATTQSQRAVLMDSMTALLAARQRERRLPGGWQGPWTVILIDPTQVTAGVSGLRALLRDGPAVGISAVCVASHARLLPQDCRAIARLQSGLGELVDISVAAEPPTTGAVCERVSAAWADRLGRDLAPLRDAECDSASAIPSNVRLTDILGLAEISDETLLRRWRTPARPCTALGVGASGPHVIDLVRDGPHALIAGSTGSGKSELLRSLVVGLATANSPADLAFVLIDYKGGAAFAECSELPHTIAVITDLDPHLTRRALISLDAELRRRESLFSEAGVSDLGAYREQPLHLVSPLPRLVLVVDEFASLTEELPDFISGLVSIAQRGRSLGFHLVLATQRPNGVVSPEIKANMALRIALRVTDPAESADILGSSEAAGIDKNRPGRAFARVADGLVEFQTARVDTAAPVPGGPQLRLLDDWNRRLASDDIGEGAKPDLRLLVDATRQAARRAGVRSPGPVWLPPLPVIVSAAECAGEDDGRHVINFGLIDQPASQRQSPLSHDLGAGGSLAFIGSARSGRTSALRTVATVAASQLGAAELHLYSIDCAGGSLRGLSQLPSCATSLSGEDPDAISRLVSLLAAELDARLARLGRVGLGDSMEARRAGIAMPAVLVVLDGWEGFTNLSDTFDAGRTAELMLRVTRDGAAAGFTVMIAGDRTLLGLRASAAVGAKLLLRLSEPTDYASAGISARAVPRQLAAGRAIVAADGAETQLAILGADPSSAAQWAAVASVASHHDAQVLNCAGTWGGATAAPIRICPLPDTVELTELTRAGDSAVLGVGGDGAGAVGVDVLKPHSRFLVAGPPRSGRSNTACLIAGQALEAGMSVLAAGANHSPFVAWARKHGVAVLRPDGGEALDHSWAQLLVIDDAEVFTDTAAGACLLEMIANEPIPVLACARSEDLLTSFRGVGVAVRRSRTGLLLHPSAIDGELLGIRVAPSRLAAPAGRGLLVTDELRAEWPSGLPIQVATKAG